ncbi:MAG: ATP-binding protein [Gammaproteobacteria bacterium]|nr:ATP-binding protein [Gammaproteobacteria bacterium]MCW8909566.1 ATP-binding protein [Gammaproteobacteria bacterium]MCW9006098.1 ATP-binding protein [Gammaproteobacteria bacterium]MCW9056702.1 ATP-binding protein [Gammaproteobacteria bacterium]
MLPFNLTEQRFSSLINNIPGIVYQCAMDEHWTMDYISQGVENLTGFKSSDFIENKIRSFASIIHPDDIQMVEDIVVAAVENNQPYTIEYRVIDSHGHSHWVYEKGRAAYNKDGQADWLDGIIFDITSRKLIEKLDEKSLHVLEKIAKGSNINEILESLAFSIENIWPNIICSVLLLDYEKQCLLHGAAPSLPDFYNNAIHGLTIGEKVGSCGTAAYTGKPCIIDDVNTHPNWAAFINLTSKAGLRACWSYPILSANNSVLGTFACYYKEKRMPSDAEIQSIQRATYLAGIAIQKKSEEQDLLNAKLTAEQASNAKSEFLSRMSHEFRTPLNAILGFSQLLNASNDLSEVHKENINEIYQAGIHLLDLVNDVLDLSRIEADKIEISISKVDIVQLLNECKNLITPYANKYKVKINIPLKDQKIIMTDPLRLKQIFLNLLNNAIKYNKENGTASVQITDNEQTIRISVTDTGMGLNNEQLSQLFTPFERLGLEKSNIEGTGIGLVITHKLVQMLGGTIGAESKSGKGSTFWIELNRT